MQCERPVSTFCHHDPADMRDPFDLYARLRPVCPVAYSSELGGFFFTTDYESTKAVLSGYRQFTSTAGVTLPALPSRMLPVDLDPPLQTKFRKVLNRFFTPEEAQRHRAAISATIEALIDDFIEDGEADLAEQLTRPAATQIMLPLIGIMERDVALERALDFVSNERTTDPARLQAEMALINDRVTTLIAARRAAADRRTDYVQLLLDETIDGRLLGDTELFEVLLVTLFGALDTTHATLTMALLHLARTPADKARLSSPDADWATAIEEFVRYASPVHFTRRTAANGVSLRGSEIAAGTPVLAGIGAANRDPDKYADPDRCILTRDAADHLGFGAGAHVCLGRHFARVMIEVVLQSALRRMVDFSVAADFTPAFTAGEGRRMIALPVRFTPGRRAASDVERPRRNAAS